VPADEEGMIVRQCRLATRDRADRGSGGGDG
jgi:hypothetical protein